MEIALWFVFGAVCVPCVGWLFAACHYAMFGKKKLETPPQPPDTLAGPPTGQS